MVRTSDGFDTKDHYREGATDGTPNSRQDNVLYNPWTMQDLDEFLKCEVQYTAGTL